MRLALVLLLFSLMGCAKEFKYQAGDCIKNISDSDLAEYLVATSTQLWLPADFWPKDKGAWVAECIDYAVGDTGEDAEEG